MEVTRKNFDTVFAELEEVFQNAQFIAFDSEFTGLNVEGAANINYFDTLEILYLKDRMKAETFMAIQFGLVAFFYDEKTKGYTHQAYNFYVYPSSLSDINFSCQSKSIDFLAQCGFDFNKLFREGIPYLKEVEVEKLVEKCEQNPHTGNAMKMEIPDEHKSSVNEVVEKIEEILQTKNKMSFKTEKFNAFVRKLIYNTVQLKYGSDVLLEPSKDETIIVSVGYSPDEIKKIEEDKILTKKNNILNELGFSKVIKLIRESKKLLIGHNLLLDILYTIRQFLAPLPDSYKEFKELVTFLFPKIIDTKHMASACGLKVDTALCTLVEHFEGLKSLPEVKIAENGKGYHLNDKKFHEAGYDAYLTGLAFLSMAKNLGNIFCNSEDFNEALDSKFLKPFINKLNIPKLNDITYMNIGGKDPEPDRQGVYYLTFPKEWNRSNILELFKNCGDFVNISWLNATSAFVKVHTSYKKEVERNLMQQNSNFTLCTFDEYVDSVLNSHDQLSSPLAKKRLSLNVKHSANNSETSFNSWPKGTTESARKRQVEEDLGEVIERPKKKKCPE